MPKKIRIKETEDITKENINVDDSFMAYEKSIYSESIYNKQFFINAIFLIFNFSFSKIK